jgi:hypothetical protein
MRRTVDPEAESQKPLLHYDHRFCVVTYRTIERERERESTEIDSKIIHSLILALYAISPELCALASLLLLLWMMVGCLPFSYTYGQSTVDV